MYHPNGQPWPCCAMHDAGIYVSLCWYCVDIVGYGWVRYLHWPGEVLQTQSAPLTTIGLLTTETFKVVVQSNRVKKELRLRHITRLCDQFCKDKAPSTPPNSLISVIVQFDAMCLYLFNSLTCSKVSIHCAENMHRCAFVAQIASASAIDCILVSIWFARFNTLELYVYRTGCRHCGASTDVMCVCFPNGSKGKAQRRQ